MSGERRVLITGATGKQGGALAQAIDIAGLEREFGFKTTRLAEWAATRQLSA